MAKPLRYKRPSRINIVSVSLLLIAAFIAYLAAQYLPLYLRKQEAYRILDETSSQFAGQKNRYLASPPHLEQLSQRMANDLRRIGISDPEMEHWIEIDDKHTVRFGVIYTETVTWPFDAIEPQHNEVQLEYVLHLKW
jgi:hypothetical protein